MLPSISVAYATFRKDAISVAPSPAHVQHLGNLSLSQTLAHTLRLSGREQLTSYVRVHDPLEAAICQPHGSAVCVEVQAQLRQLALCKEGYSTLHVDGHECKTKGYSQAQKSPREREQCPARCRPSTL